MATLARQERIKISERKLAGLETARAKGKSLGRPKKIFDRERLVRLRKAGWSLGQLGKEFKISRTHVARLLTDDRLKRSDEVVPKCSREGVCPDLYAIFIYL
jgi:DNA invertase Pin-like site-specific DNA recombinase